ncbi:hypothetical protein F9K79_15500 [Ochrobactrum sp. Kaboul]|nr:hypothetical protein F9K79_15500 [Ochrobactrum sp. Kaboul]
MRLRQASGRSGQRQQAGYPRRRSRHLALQLIITACARLCFSAFPNASKRDQKSVQWTDFPA